MDMCYIYRLYRIYIALFSSLSSKGHKDFSWEICRKHYKVLEKDYNNHGGVGAVGHHLSQIHWRHWWENWWAYFLCKSIVMAVNWSKWTQNFISCTNWLSVQLTVYSKPLLCNFFLLCILYTYILCFHNFALLSFKPTLAAFLLFKVILVKQSF